MRPPAPTRIPVLISGWRPLVLLAGPYWRRPPGVAGFLLAAENIADPRIASLLIEDFGVPDSGADARAALMRALILMRSGAQLYVGCTGGLGRTGLFLALLTKVQFASYQGAWGDPVAHVRATYHPWAVETREQEGFIRWFNPWPVVDWAARIAGAPPQWAASPAAGK